MTPSHSSGTATRPRMTPWIAAAGGATIASLLTALVIPARQHDQPTPSPLRPASALAATSSHTVSPAAQPERVDIAIPDPLAGIPPPELPIQAPNAPAPSRDHLRAMVDDYADDHLVERALAHAVVQAESNYNPFAVSSAGAIGLMQVMPATATDYGVTAAADLFDPAINLATGMRHLRRLLEKYDGDVGLAVMAYNAGENALERAGTHLTYPETLTYADRVLRGYLANGGTRPATPSLTKIEQLRIIGAAGIVKRIERKSIDLSATSLDGLPPLSLRNIEPRLRAVVAPGDTAKLARATP